MGRNLLSFEYLAQQIVYLNLDAYDEKNPNYHDSRSNAVRLEPQCSR